MTGANITTNGRVEYMFGIPLYSWERWNDMGDGIVCFYNIQWKFPSMEKYNGCDLYHHGYGELAGTVDVLINAENDTGIQEQKSLSIWIFQNFKTQSYRK